MLANKLNASRTRFIIPFFAPECITQKIHVGVEKNHKLALMCTCFAPFIIDKYRIIKVMSIELLSRNLFLAVNAKQQDILKGIKSKWKVIKILLL